MGDPQARRPKPTWVRFLVVFFFFPTLLLWASSASAQLPSGFSDTDIGSVGLAGSSSYSNNVFTVEGSGTGMASTSDEFHFVYQPLSGDGTIVARVVSLTGGQAAVMIRQTLNANDEDAYVQCSSSYNYFYYRPSTGGNATTQGYVYHGLPYWIKVVRSSNTFSAYASLDGVNWTQIATSETISMTTNVYVGLGVSSESNNSLATATFDNVSISPTASPAPSITGLSATTGTIGSGVVISGSGFGASQGSSLALLNGSGLTVDSWSDTSITATIPTGASTGPVVVSVAPSMNDSNPVYFEVTTEPLPTSWLDEDIGAVGLQGSATYSNGVFTVEGSGSGVTGTSDEFHFVYQPLSGDGTIVARVLSITGGQAGVMIRQTLTPNDMMADVYCTSNNCSQMDFGYRLTTGGSVSTSYMYPKLPYWVKLVRSGSSFSGYTSLDGVNWTQLGSTETISMTTNVYIGLFVSSTSLTLPNGVTASYTFDNGSQLTGISYALGQNSLGNLSYGYDLAGRRTSMGGSLAQVNLPNAISTTAYDSANELTQWGTATPTYDADGNMLSDGTNTYVWDSRNHLASMNSGADTFQYDSFGRRVGKTTILGATNYLYDGANPVQELSGTTPTANMLNGFGADEYFTRTDSSGTANFVDDALGSTLALTDNSGNTLAQYTYEPFGNTTATGTSTNSYQFTGRENDGTGVEFYRSRYYSPTVQRFIGEDRIGYWGGDPNLYAYVQNGSTNEGDAGGTNPACAIGALVGYNAYLAGQVYSEVSVLFGRKWSSTKIKFRPGLSGALHGLAGGVPWAIAGCAAGFGVGAFSGASAEAAALGEEATAGQTVVNLGGEGEVPGAINVQGSWASESGFQFAGNAAGQTLEQASAMDQYVIADNTSLPFADGSVDTVITNNVPIDQTTALGPGVQTSEIYRILSEAGTWIHNGVVMPIP